MEDKYKLHTVKEIIAIGKRDAERFVAICNYYLMKDNERFHLIVKPMLEEMIKNYEVK